MTQQKTWKNPGDQQLRSTLREAKNIAVVGCSPKPDRTSHQITAFLIKQGYNVFPIHPKAKGIWFIREMRPPDFHALRGFSILGTPNLGNHMPLYGSF